MGEISDDGETALEEWAAMVRFNESHPGLQAFADDLRAAGPPPSGLGELAASPVILDTDIGGDPDDAFAVAVAALAVPQLALVVTSDEIAGQRARFARHLLDLLGRPEVPVVAGQDLGNTRYFCVPDLVPDEVPDQPDDVMAAVDAVCGQTQGPVRWVGTGPASNLATVLTTRAHLAQRLRITQMGGALAYRDPTRAEHNFRLDPEAAATLLRLAHRPALVLSDTTFTTAIEITQDSPIYHALAADDAPPWAGLLRAHLDNWAARFHPGTMQHDALTLSAALGWPGVRFGRENITLDGQARMTRASHGLRVKISIAADYPDFMTWLANRLTPELQPDRSHRPPAGWP
jgi:pyrimidine-specific ribonucleoside hydrolase